MAKLSEKSKLRDTNLDLFRIFSMLLIVLLHSIDHSGVLEEAENSSGALYFYVRFLYMLCQVCVNCYVMLSGYYLVKAKFRLKKLVSLWMETAFYSFVLKFIFTAGGAQMSIISLASCFVPITTGRYWFITIYAAMYLLFPFLNILIHAMDRKTHGRLNICLFLLASLWSSLHPSIAGINSGGGWGLAWFIVLYLAASWFRLYYEPHGNEKTLLAGYLLIPLMTAAIQLLLRVIQFGLAEKIVGNWFRYDSAPVYIMTMCLFAVFLNIRLKNKKISKCIQVVSPLTFGVYLIHAHANVSPWIWENLALPEKMDSIFFPIIQITSVLVIFAVCAAIDYVCKHTVGRIENAKWVDRICGNIEKIMNTRL